MEDFKQLVSEFWVIKKNNREKYFKMKAIQPQIRKFVTEQLGWKIIANEHLIKIEKVPAYAEPYMGIKFFEEKMDYCIFCAVLIYLEDMSEGEQFLLSELISFIEMYLVEHIEVDWTKFVHRKSLVRVLKYCENISLVDVYEGSNDDVSNNINTEVLYENTGFSRYFATNFSFDISNFKNYKDFEEKEEVLDSNRGYIRINRVYRRLVTTPVVYSLGLEDFDYAYIKNQRPWLQKNIYDYFGGELHIHKNGAFLLMNEENSFGTMHPKDNMISDVVTLLCSRVCEYIKKEWLVVETNDTIKVDHKFISENVEICKSEFSEAWSKEYREMSVEKLTNTVISYMSDFMMIKKDEGKIIIMPSIAKIIGVYPKDFNIKKEQQSK